MIQPSSHFFQVHEQLPQSMRVLISTLGISKRGASTFLLKQTNMFQAAIFCLHQQTQVTVFIRNNLRAM